MGQSNPFRASNSRVSDSGHKRQRRPQKRRRRNAFNKRTLVTVGGGVLGLLVTLAIGATAYYLIMINKIQPAEVVFTGQPDIQMEELIDLYEEDIHTDVSDDLEAAEAHEDEFEQLLLAAEEEAAMEGSEAGDIQGTNANQGGQPQGTKADSAPAQPKQQSLPAIRRSSSVKNYLVIGVDSRGNDFSGRSDSMMVVSINQNSGRINIVSLFRGAYVNIPGRGWGMLGHSYAYGGPRLLQQTIENNFRIGIDGYIIFNFNAFVSSINAVGGVTINLTDREARELGLSPGSNNLNANQALRYARLRKIDSDFARMGRQRAVMGAVASKLQRSSVSTINRAVSAVLSNSATNISSGTISSLTSNLPRILNYPRSERQYPLANTRSKFYKNGLEMWSFNFLTNINSLHQLLYGG